MPRRLGAGCFGGPLRLADAEQRSSDLAAGVEQPVEDGVHVRVGDREPGCVERRVALAFREVVGAENLCHQAIFMNHAACAVTPLDPELIQVGDAIG